MGYNYYCNKETYYAGLVILLNSRLYVRETYQLC